MTELHPMPIHKPNDDERAAQWCLWSIPGIGPVRMTALLTRYVGGAAELWEMLPPELESVLDAMNWPQTVRRMVREKLRRPPSCWYQSELNALPTSTRLLHVADESYPARLRQMETPPYFVYICGKICINSLSRAVAVVGSRNVCTRYAQMTHSMAQSLGHYGVAVISGGARGVDKVAHEACVGTAARTVAVLPGGLRRLTPRANRELFSVIARRGALISEYPLDVSARRYHFVRRNGLIAALSDAVIVMRAGISSGTMLTARAAMKLERPLFVLPCDIGDMGGEGNLELLFRGARAIRNAGDVMALLYNQPGLQASLCNDSASDLRAHDIPSARHQHIEPKALACENLSSEGKQLMEIFRLHYQSNSKQYEGILVDDISTRIGWPVARLQRVLVELELSQCIVKVVGANAYRVDF